MVQSGLIHHIEINVSDLEKSKDFWGFVLGFFEYEKYQDWPEGVSWKKGESYIVLVQTREKHLDHTYNRCDTGLNHLAFHAESKDQVKQITKELRSRNVTILYEDRYPYAGGRDHMAVFFEDPDRIKLEITAPEQTD